jgi:hypothetical protein
MSRDFPEVLGFPQFQELVCMQKRKNYKYRRLISKDKVIPRRQEDKTALEIYIFRIKHYLRRRRKVIDINWEKWTRVKTMKME